MMAADAADALPLDISNANRNSFEHNSFSYKFTFHPIQEGNLNG